MGGATLAAQAPDGASGDALQLRPATGGRLQYIDALRGLAMVLMLLDHLRDTWLAYVEVGDPVDPRTTLPAIAISRVIASLCAPIFVALTGLGVFLYHRNHTLAETTTYLLKRGLLLIVIEVCYLSPIYWFAVRPMFWLQVIWVIGICMIVLAGLIRLPRWALIGVGLAIVCGHNLLDPIRLAPGQPLFGIWAVAHQRAVMTLPFGLAARTSYPVLPWIGVIALGYGIGPWFGPAVEAAVRRRRLLVTGIGMLVAFAVLRLLNGYGDHPWSMVEGSTLRTVIGFISLTKYPPSLMYILFTLGIGALLLAAFEALGDAALVRALAVFGGAPMFFYLMHLTALRIFYHITLAIWGTNHGQVFGFPSYDWIVASYFVLIVPFYIPTVWFSRLKKRRRDITWLTYF